MRVLFALLLVGLAVGKFSTCLPGEKGADNTYTVVFHYEQAPDTSSKEIVQAWADKILGGGIITHAFSIHEFRGFGGVLSASQLGLLLNLPEVLEVSEDCIFSIPEGEMSQRNIVDRNSTLGTPPTTLPGWGQRRSDQNTATFSTTWTFAPGTTGTNTNVWVLDTGCRCTHEQLTGRCTMVYSAFPAQPTDENGHGTHCAGTVAGAFGGTYSAGYAIGTKIWCIKVLSNQGSGSNNDIISAVDYVVANKKAGYNIISMSLGGGLNTALNTACNNAVNAGVMVVVAAGNSNVNAQNTSPCAATQTICVASTNSANQISSYSNFGTIVDIAAPGEQIQSAWYTSDTAYNTISGTSMATPAVAGQVAMWFQKTGQTTRAQLKTVISNFATKNSITNYASKPLAGNWVCYDRWQ
jgi:subtilisin family serine protease